MKALKFDKNHAYDIKVQQTLIYLKLGAVLWKTKQT